MLFDVKGRDLMAIQYSYHRTCYASYINIKTLTKFTKHETPNNDVFPEAFKKVCEINYDSVIRKRRALEMICLRD